MTPGRPAAISRKSWALGQVVAGQLVLRRQLPQLGSQPPVAADDLLAKALHPQVVEPPAVAVALTGGVDDGQVLGALPGQRRLFQRHHDLLRVHQTSGKPAKGNGVPVVETGGDDFLRCQNFWHDSTSFLHDACASIGLSQGRGT